MTSCQPVCADRFLQPKLGSDMVAIPKEISEIDRGNPFVIEIVATGIEMYACSNIPKINRPAKREVLLILFTKKK